MSPVCSIILLVITSAGFAAEIGRTPLTFPVRYEGGTLPLSQGKISATLVENEVVFLAGSQRLAIPLRSITAVTYGSDVHRKSLLRFVPFLDFDKAFYVSLSWRGDAGRTSQAGIEAVLKLSEGKSQQFVAVLERMTGIKAVNADRLPAIVRYEVSSAPASTLLAGPSPAP